MKFITNALQIGILLGFISAHAPAEIEEHENLYVMPERLEEFDDWRFGLFIHWGPWSQTEVGYIWKMVDEDTLAERRKVFSLYRTFDPVNFAPERWAKAAKDAGMKYVVFVTKHHDGMNNYDTNLSDFKVTSPACPWSAQPQPDLTRSIVDAFRAEGLAIGFYFSHIDWHHPDGKYFSLHHPEYDPERVNTHPDSWERFAAYEKGQIRELLTNYGKIDLLWFDIGWPFAGYGGKLPIKHPRVKEDVIEMLSMIKELQPDIIFNDRGLDKFGGFYTPEQLVPKLPLPGYWESSITITNDRGYWYKGDHVSSKSGKELTRLLIEIAAKGGNFLMNVGPRPDGELSQGEYEAMAAVGDWMEINSDSIYETDQSLFNNLPWGQSTTKGNTVYLHVYDWPSDGKLIVPGLQTLIRTAYHLGDTSRHELKTSPAGDDYIVHVGPVGSHPSASVLVLEFDETPVVQNAIRAGKDGTLTLISGLAEITSETASYNFGENIRPGKFIEFISSEKDTINWNFKINEPGSYDVIVDYAARTEDCGGDYTVKIGSLKPLSASVEITGEWDGPLVRSRKSSNHGHDLEDNDPLFGAFNLGTVKLDKPGVYSISLSPKNLIADTLFSLREIKLVPTK
ncbi:alpha-L-fucosidase [Puniceicoccaceae bacterium K14]|nr:alpha-L-fucosidase [Puniceicoccaceae bacterium K14]